MGLKKYLTESSRPVILPIGVIRFGAALLKRLEGIALARLAMNVLVVCVYGYVVDLSNSVKVTLLKAHSDRSGYMFASTVHRGC